MAKISENFFESVLASRRKIFLSYERVQGVQKMRFTLNYPAHIEL